MKALSIRQPYAWAVLAGHKPVENRTYMRHHRGLLAIHAPQAPHRLGLEDPLVHAAWEDDHGGSLHTDHGELPYGAIIGVVDMVSAHVAEQECCKPWGQHYPRAHHWGLADPVVLAEPIRCLGRLGMWDLPPAMALAVREQIPPRH